MEKEIRKLIETFDSPEQSEVLKSIQGLTAVGDEYLGLISNTLVDNPGISESLKKVIIYMIPPREIHLLCAFLESKNSNLAIAAFGAIALSKDINSLKCLYKVYEKTWRKELAAKTIGKLGFKSAEVFLNHKINEVINRIEGVLNINKSSNRDEYFDESDLTLYMCLLKSLKQIGGNENVNLLPAIGKYASNEEYSDASIIRAKAIGLLSEIRTIDSLHLLQNSIRSNDFEIRNEALLGLLLIGTPEAMRPLFEISIEDEISSSDRLFWCLKQWSGVDIKTLEGYQAWWKTHESSFTTNSCYKYGDLIDINTMIKNLTGGIIELEYKFMELEIYTGIDFSVCLYRHLEYDFIEKVNKLWEEEGFHFERGVHYRYGRKESFGLL
jgi:hypothetical protein